MAFPMADGRPFGTVATDWQKADGLAVLDQGGPLNHWQSYARGGGKSEQAGRVGCVAHMTQAPLGATSFVVAADLEQGNLVLDSVRSFVLHRPELRSALRVEAKRVVFLRNGEAVGTLTVVPADQWSAFGLRPWIVIADELANWPSTPNARGVWSAMVSALPKVPGARLLVLTSAGDPAHWSYKVREQALASGRWRVSEVEGPLPWVSAEALEEQRALLLPSQYERLHLNRWVSGEGALTTPEQVRACVGHNGPLEPEAGRRYAMSLDLGLVRDRSVLTISHTERRDGRLVVVVDRQQVWRGTKDRPVALGDVEQAILLGWRTYGHAVLVVDPWNAALLVQRVRAKGVSVREYSFSVANIGRLAQVLYRLLRDAALDLDGDDEELISELSRARLVEVQPNVFRLDHHSGEHDDRVISLALGAHVLTERGEIPAAIAHAAAGRLPATPTSTEHAPMRPAPFRIGRRRLTALERQHYKAPERDGPW